MATLHASALAADALAGLWSRPPTLPPRWLYDERGSRLFEEITQLPEYYLTRRETEILRTAAAAIARLADAATLVELGAGASIKTRLLLDAITGGRQQKLIYVPVDVSTEMITEAADQLRQDYPTVVIDPCVAEFDEGLHRLDEHPAPRLLIFLGSTIGNLDAEQRSEFLRQVRDALQPDDQLLLGIDLIKSEQRLTAAYDDAAQITAKFNRNLIEVLGRELDAEGLNAEDFEHVARWNRTEGRMEMRLRARCAINAHFRVLGRDWSLEPGTEILTEISTKFTLDGLRADLADAELAARRVWTDADHDYALVLIGPT